MTRAAVVTIHDVAPHTWRECISTLRWLRRLAVEPVTLLVMPGFPWARHQLAGLRSLAADGVPLAAHGWSHQAVPPRTAFHRLHAALISRDQAEHLSRPLEELRGIVRRSREWFGESWLPIPSMYVPPAWALGALREEDLRALPFEVYEGLTGIFDSVAGRWYRMGLVGFLADEPRRVLPLRWFNRANVALSRQTGLPLRIGIHPPDLRLPLASDLRRLLGLGWRFTDVYGAMADPQQVEPISTGKSRPMTTSRMSPSEEESFRAPPQRAR